MFEKVLKLWRETFPQSKHNLMSIEYVAAIEEFNEYFPGYATMNEQNYRKLRKYYRNLKALPLCLPLRNSYASAMALDNSLEEWLENNPEKRSPGLSGEWAVDIFADHNERVMQKYRKYKSQRLLKLSLTVDERKERANKMIIRNNFELKWLLGREEWNNHSKQLEEKYRQEVEEKVRAQVQKELGL
ncbi:unnamed protein product [Caenorhabditis sp. 36 PRJEB53466]|nr:unnamed protein product [Caenorhabditis sp. 36 PRJEB53466]